MNFDKVEYDHPSGAQVLSLKEFVALSPLERVKGIAAGKFRFFRNGVKIAATEALKVQGKS